MEASFSVYCKEGRASLSFTCGLGHPDQRHINPQHLGDPDTTTRKRNQNKSPSKVSCDNARAEAFQAARIKLRLQSSSEHMEKAPEEIVNKTIDLPVSQRNNSQLNSKEILELLDREDAEREAAKDALLDYVNNIRADTVVDNLWEFMPEEDINSFLNVLRFVEETELKLVKKSSYQDILSEIQNIGEAAKKRQQEYKLRPVAIDMFGWCLQAAQKLVDSFNAGNEELNHLDPAEVDKVQRAVLEKQE